TKLYVMHLVNMLFMEQIVEISLNIVSTVALENFSWEALIFLTTFRRTILHYYPSRTTDMSNV
ncbi:hypothetical protein ACJX0J_030559, partial [Zea mays]